MSRGLSFAAAVLCALSTAADLGAQVRTSDNIAIRIDSLVHAALANDKTPGITIAVVKGSDTIALQGYGVADVENNVAATRRSVFHIASITKQFTAAAIMKLVEAGKIKLDATVGDYLTDYEGPARRVTIHQLLTHTGGVPNYTDMGRKFADQSRLDLTHEQMVALWARDPLAFEPGSKWAYSNSGYYLLGMIIEKLTGKTYEQHLRGTLWEPLGLTQTYYCAQRDIIPHRARSYGLRDGKLFNAPPASMNGPFAAGALCSTPHDLVRWTRALHTGKVVTPQSFALMTTPVRLSGGSTNPYGYGLTNAKLGNVAAIQHGGGINGFSANLARYPEHNLTIAVIVNGPTSSSTLAQRIAYLVLGMPDPATIDLATTKEERARYAGTYEVGTGTERREIRVFEQDGRLFAQMSGQNAFPLRRQAEHTFDGPAGTGVRMSFTMSGDRATGFTLPNGGVTARRID